MPYKYLFSARIEPAVDWLATVPNVSSCKFYAALGRRKLISIKVVSVRAHPVLDYPIKRTYYIV